MKIIGLSVRSVYTYVQYEAVKMFGENSAITKFSATTERVRGLAVARHA